MLSACCTNLSRTDGTAPALVAGVSAELGSTCEDARGASPSLSTRILAPRGSTWPRSCWKCAAAFSSGAGGATSLSEGFKASASCCCVSSSTNLLPLDRSAVSFVRLLWLAGGKGSSSSAPSCSRFCFSQDLCMQSTRGLSSSGQQSLLLATVNGTSTSLSLSFSHTVSQLMLLYSIRSHTGIRCVLFSCGRHGYLPLRTSPSRSPTAPSLPTRLWLRWISCTGLGVSFSHLPIAFAALSPMQLRCIFSFSTAIFRLLRKLMTAHMPVLPI
mmetsp:Transcript_44783/g.106306  ORF Transcript_44783/g.106306 Transcript_44783/m.106306 type:complete len:271 (-) Transcript_44783:305-1117(-)